VANGGLLLDREVGWGEDIREPYNHLLGLLLEIPGWQMKGNWKSRRETR
jgi:hypothetical protein